MSKQVLLGGLVLGSFIFVAMPVRASVNVDISNNAAGSSNRVNVNSTTQNANSKTDVRVETNGEVKEFHTQGDEDVNYQSDDGSVKVNVNNATAPSTSSKVESKTEIENDVDVSVGDEGEESNEVEEATDSPDINDEVEDENKPVDQEESSLVENILMKWEEWNEVFKDKIRKLFE